MKKEKSFKLCIVEGCKNRHDLNNWRCEKHSVQYYGGSVLGFGRLTEASRTARHGDPDDSE